MRCFSFTAGNFSKVLEVSTSMSYNFRTTSSPTCGIILKILKIQNDKMYTTFLLLVIS